MNTTAMLLSTTTLLPPPSAAKPAPKPARRKRTKGDTGMLVVGAVLAVGAAYAGVTLLGLTKAHADTGLSGNASACWSDVQTGRQLPI